MAGKIIFLIGFMGCGKSTVSEVLADRFGFERIDSDEYIENVCGMSIPDIFEKYGEEYFRERETEFLDKLDADSPVVIACGGGMAMRPRNAQIMKNKGLAVFLSAKPRTIYERVKDSTDRPLLNGHMNIEYIKELMESRIKAYAGAASIRVETDGRTPEDIADEIIKKYG